MNPENPMPWEVRDIRSDYIIYYNQTHDNPQWNFERVSDGYIMASGTLNNMLALIPQYPNSRRATWSEDMLRWRPKCWELEYDYPV